MSSLKGCLIDHGCAINPLYEQHRQDVEKKVESQSAANLQWKVLKAQQSIRTNQVVYGKHSVEQATIPGMLRLCDKRGVGVPVFLDHDP